MSKQRPSSLPPNLPDRFEQEQDWSHLMSCGDDISHFVGVCGDVDQEMDLRWDEVTHVVTPLGDGEESSYLGSDNGNNLTKSSVKCSKPKELSQGSLWRSATIFKNSVAAKLRKAGEDDLADTLEECHTRVTVQECTGCRKVTRFYNRCDNFFCPECQPRLSKLRADGVKWWAAKIKQPKHVVLTVTNTKDLTREHVKEFKGWWSKLRRSKVFKGVRGGFYNLEVTNEGRGWHLHLHALVDVNYLPVRDLEKAWARTTNGAGKIVRVYDARKKDYLAEVTKYAVKGSQLSGWAASEIITFIRAFMGQRTFGVFGELYGRRKEWADTLAEITNHARTCECGCQKFLYSDEETYAARLEMRGSIEKAERPPPTPTTPEFAQIARIDLRNMRASH